MPVIAVAAVWWGGAALLAGAEGFAAVAAIGAIASGVGTLTGNKTLTQVGMVMGVVGGVGGLATGANFMGSDTAPAPIEEATITPTGGGTSAPVVPTPAPTVDPTSAVVPAPVADLPGNGSPLNPPAATMPGATAPTGATFTPGILDTSGGVNNLGDLGGKTLTSNDWGSQMFDANQGAPDGKSLLDRFSAFADAHSMAAYGMMQVGGAMAQGLFNPLTGAQKAALDAQAASNNAAADLARQRAANIGAPLPVASAGILNSPNAGMTVGSPITGRIA